MVIRWFVASIGILAVVVIAIAVPVLSHITSPAGNARGVTRDRDPSTGVLPLFFSEVGLVWPRERLGHFDSAEEAIQEFLTSKDASDAAVCIPADRGMKLLEEEQFPILFETKAGNFRLFTGAHVDSEERRYYQYFSSRNAPRLVNASDVQSGHFRKAWSLACKNRSSLALDVAQSRLQIDRVYHNFGTVLPGAELQTEFHIANSGDSPVKLVGQPFASCGCTVAEFRGDRLMLPGAAITLPVKVRAGSEGFGHNVTVQFAEESSGKRPEALKFRLYASQVDAMEVSPGQLNFGTVASGEVVERRVRLSEVSTDRFAVTSIDVHGLPIEHAVDSRKSRGDLHDWIITLMLCSAEAPGEHEGVVDVHTSSKLISDVVVPVSYKVASRVKVSPPMLVWNVIQLGEVASPKKAILSCVERDERVRVRVKGAPAEALFDAQVESLPEGASVLVVRPKPSDAGALEGCIWLSVESADWTEAVSVRCSALVVD